MIRTIVVLMIQFVLSPCFAQQTVLDAVLIRNRLVEIESSNLDSLATRKAVEQFAHECQKMNLKAYAVIPGMFPDPLLNCALCQQNIERIEMGTACIYDVREQEIVHYFNELMSEFNAFNGEIPNSEIILKDELNKHSNWQFEVINSSDTLRLILHHLLIDSMFAHFADAISVSMKCSTQGVLFFETELTYRQLSTDGIFCFMDASVCEGKMHISLNLRSIPSNVLWGWCDCEGKNISRIIPLRRE